MSQPPLHVKSILVIRRDNIGDLVCSTPLLHALRQTYPAARIDVLANTYNAPVLQEHPDIDHLYAYMKAKHRPEGMSKLKVYLQRLRLLIGLRRTCYDLIILAQSEYQSQAAKFARFLKGQYRLGYVDTSSRSRNLIDLPLQPRNEHTHEAQACLDLMQALGQSHPNLPLSLGLSLSEKFQVQRLRQDWLQAPAKRLVGLHISARLPSQRWPLPHWLALIEQLNDQDPSLHFVLFWSPGTPNHPQHPGDDALAETLLTQSHLPLSGYPTQDLRTLMTGLAAIDLMIMSDGGAMHIAAALGKPMVCFFGESSPQRWHPWMCPHELLQPPSHQIKDVSVEQVLKSLRSLMHKLPSDSAPAAGIVAGND